MHSKHGLLQVFYGFKKWFDADILDFQLKTFFPPKLLVPTLKNFFVRNLRIFIKS